MSISVNASRALERALHGEELSYRDGLELMEYDDIHALGIAADAVRRRLKGDTVTFTCSYYINYTNVCAASCPLCAFYRKEGDDDAYTLSVEDMVRRAGSAVMMGANELHIVGGFHPRLGLEYYEAMIRAIKSRFNGVTVKALTPAEVFFISRVTHNTVREVLSRLKDAGLDALAGGGAEIFHREVRDRIVVGKCSGEEWLHVAEEAHRLGIRGNCTMLYGHIERGEHVVDHLLRLRELQKRTRGFLTFIPLKFSPENTELYEKGLVREQCPSTYDLRIIAVSRLMLAGAIDNISVYWLALGKKLAQVGLCYGGNDLVGTAFAEEIYRATGVRNATSIEELVHMVREIGRVPALRDTFHNIVRYF
ncbi:MAG: CofH family radical SAM protein [Candidatus Nitrosocaldus sp.]|nr:CofH family radical SAM protein [Candidatus Nitrosocaldus sp.]MDW8276089.1 CofH family radical SAM protein [Candidatus Nitrosocaldus sp.]